MQAKKTVLGISQSGVDFIEGALDPEDDPYAAARNLSTPVWVFDIDRNRIVFANASACKMWQADDEDDLRSRDMSDGMSKTVANRLKQYQADFIRKQTTFREMWTLYPNGKPVSSSVAFRGFRLPDGRMAMQCEVLAQAEDEPDNLRSAEALLHTDVMIAQFEFEGAALYMNPAARKTMGGAAPGLSKLFVDPTDYHVMMFDLDGKGEHRLVAKVRAESDELWFDISAKLCNDAVTGKPAILLTAIDVSELKTARDKARYLADRDQLTGCFNRAFMQRHIDQLSASQAPECYLLYFDVDRFKHVNDTFGHEAGDDVLKELALRAQNAVGAEDLVVRLGGDEFAILIQNADETDQLSPKVKDVYYQLCGSIVSGSASILTTVSMGVTKFCPAEIDFEGALRQADFALYHSKRTGRHQCTIYDAEMGQAALERTAFEAEIERALEERQFILHYQPRMDLRSGKVVSMEGLVRWRHPTRGLIAPNSFIPVCEETGMIEALGQQVLEMGFEQAMKWDGEGRDLHLSLNISPRQFADDALMEFLKSFAEQPDFPTEKIELEITENVLIGDLEVIATKLRAISEMGYQIAVDDFGTGYSNLSYISRFPLSCLKIDQTFIQQLPESGPIVGLIFALGKQIGATIVAEGVETQEQFDWLSKSDCDQIQGYFISRPAELDDLESVFSAA